jgi:hypothetical protein
MVSFHVILAIFNIFDSSWIVLFFLLFSLLLSFAVSVGLGSDRFVVLRIRVCSLELYSAITVIRLFFLLLIFSSTIRRRFFNSVSSSCFRLSHFFLMDIRTIGPPFVFDGKYNRLKIKSNYDNDSGRQTYPETLFIDGSIYISETLEFLKTQQLIGEDPEIMITPQSHAIDIDTPFDLKIARAMYDSEIF